MRSLPLRVGLAALGPVLILLAFGIHDLRAFVAQPARPVFLVVLFLGRILMGGAYRFKIDVTSEAKTQVLIPLTVITATITAMLALPWLDAHPEALPALRFDHSAVRWVGVVAFGVGIGTQAWATITLGRWFSPRIAIQAGHQLIQTGPYAWVRHPFYTGLLASVIGFPAVFGSWVGLPAAVLGLPVVLYRVRVEERLLAAEFGEEFKALEQRTRRLIPLVY